MTRGRLMQLSERWFTLLQRLYPPDFRDDMGGAFVETYMDRARDVMKTGGPFGLAALWVRALADSIRNGPAEKTGAALISALAVGALLLAAMGLYGVVSGSVTRRRHELAVRLALGADHGCAVRLLLREGATLVMMGILIAAPGIYIAGGLIRGVLVGVSPSDPLTLAAVALVLLLVTMGTCYVPARRAMGIDPARLLRQE